MKTAIVDERLPREAEAELRARGFEVLRLPASNKLSPPVASHTDMLLFASGKALFGSSSYFEEHEEILIRIKELLPAYDIILTGEVHEKE